MHLQTRGDVDASPRMDQFMRPHFGFRDELRLVFTDDRGMLWGGLALFREDDEPFDADEVDFAAGLSSVFALGMRAGLLATLAAGRTGAIGGPAVLVVDAQDRVVRTSLGAEGWLAELAQGPASGGPLAPVASLVGAARRFARGETTVVPRSRVRAASGMWLVMHATPAQRSRRRERRGGGDDRGARPPEIVPLVVAAFGLTPRERDVTQLVLQGLGTREIAAAVHLSAYTVQDHLKSVLREGRGAQPARARRPHLLRPVRPADGRRPRHVRLVRPGRLTRAPRTAGCGPPSRWQSWRYRDERGPCAGTTGDRRRPPAGRRRTLSGQGRGR